MRKEFRNFTVIISAVTIAILILGGFLFWKLIPQYYTPALPIMLLLFYVVTTVSFWQQIKLMHADLAKFPRYQSIITILKLMVYLAFGVVYMFLKKTNLIPFVIELFTLYVIYSFLETYFLSKASRRIR